MAHHRLEIVEACVPCKSTGLFIGIAERDGSAVVCHDCCGTGRHKRVIEWDDFKGRRRRAGVTRVVEVNPGICIGTGKNKKYTLADFGGMSYEQWWSGALFEPGMENRRFTCPAWWYQTADYEKKPKWPECGYGAFNTCRYFAAKDMCWNKWDAEARLDAGKGKQE